MNKEGLVNGPAEIKLLLREARAGNEDAFRRLLTIYEPLIISMLTKYNGENDRDDLHQELLLAFYHAVRKYDLEQKSVDFGFFAKVCLKNALISHIRKSGGEEIEILPIDEIKGLYSQDAPESSVFESESTKTVQKLVDENLSSYEKRVWELYVDGKKPAEIAHLLGKDAKSITNALARIRAKLRALIGDIYHI
jgi:RNA polymerase sporulation-specific sigma factor